MALVDSRTTIQVSEDMRKRLRVLASRRDASYGELLSDMVEVFEELQPNQTIISIPKQLAEKIKVRVSGTGCATISEYITYILREVVVEVPVASKGDWRKMSPDQEEKIRKRLVALGYL